MIRSLFGQGRSSFFKFGRSSPRLSVVVIVFNMRREAPRTLFSLSPDYQQGVSAADYEIVVVENGSSEPLAAADIAGFGPNFRYIWIDNASPSPARAINRGVASSKAPYVGVMIDGARIATPGVIALALLGLQRFERAVVGTVGFHLGPDTQMYSLRHGYNRAVEDGLLASVDWQHHGYRLFEIGSQAGSSPLNWLGAINESNLIFLPRRLFEQLGGYDERFSLPGGGIVNLDFYRRACELEGSTLITLLGEATFHQVHGGAITNQPAAELPQRLQKYGEEYLRIRGEPFAKPVRPALLLGQVRPESLPWLGKACDFAARLQPSPRVLPAIQPSAQDLADDSLTATPTVLLSACKRLGLRPRDDVLELISAPQPLGLALIPYLEPNRYRAIEFTDDPACVEMTTSLGRALMEQRQAHFARNDDFNLDVFDRGFDFILAASLFRHTSLSQIRRCLSSARQILKASGLLVAGFAERAADQARDEWTYPNFNCYCWTTLARLCAELGLHCRQLDWPYLDRTWFAAAIDPRRLETPAPPA
ncbi:MAG TPA: glycosyltransferase family A protein [Candidatus Competibacter sp.]|nr:glycosyltransferase family A protein [Candidatus Competibacter sp.]